MTEEQAVKKFLDALYAELNYHEVGYNHNKYAQYIDKCYPNFYNSCPKDGYAWCCIFPHAVGIQQFGYENAKKLFCVPEHNDAAGCSGVARYYREAGRRIIGCENLRPGDQIVFGSNSYDHTGILYQVIDGKNGIYRTIEGNYSDSVCLVERRYSQMIFVGRPNWAAVADVDPDPQPEPTPEPTPIEHVVVNAQILSDLMAFLPDMTYGDGLGDPKLAVTILQQLLNFNGIPVDVDGEFGGMTEDAVMQFLERRKGE